MGPLKGPPLSIILAPIEEDRSINAYLPFPGLALGVNHSRRWVWDHEVIHSLAHLVPTPLPKVHGDLVNENHHLAIPGLSCGLGECRMSLKGPSGLRKPIDLYKAHMS